MEAPQKVTERASTVWLIDPAHTSVEFSIQTLFWVTVKGRLSELAGTIVLDENDVRHSVVEATLRAASIETGIQRRDAHLRSADFLAAERYPEIHFQSTKVGPGRDYDTLRVTGPLTIKGQSREVALEVTEVDRSRSPRGDEVIYYTVWTELDRFDFGIRYARGLIGRKLKVTINVQAMRQH